MLCLILRGRQEFLPSANAKTRFNRRKYTQMFYSNTLFFQYSLCFQNCLEFLLKTFFLILPSSSLVSLLLVGKQTDTQACKIFRFPSHLWLINVCSICRFCSKTTACSRFIRYCRQASQSQRRICCINVCFCRHTKQGKKIQPI